MTPERLLICTDLDRTLLPNGPQPESPGARALFTRLATRPEVTLAYVSGRHRALVEQAIFSYGLPQPEYVVGDVGTSLYRVDSARQWHALETYERDFADDWAGRTHAELKDLLRDLPDLKLQETAKQNHYKLSYYVVLQADRHALTAIIRHRLTTAGIDAALIWSGDELQGTGLLDILPARASKLYAVQALMQMHGFDAGNTLFCGDSGNDIEVLASAIPAVLVANAQHDVQQLARRLADESGHAEQLYIARGGYLDMNGNYSAGILEGIAHYHPGFMQQLLEER